MKKLFASLVAAFVGLSGHAADIATNPSPVISNKPVEVTISYADLGTEVYCYTWCIFTPESGLPEKAACDWNSTNTQKYRMGVSNGNYTYAISNIKEFYGLNDTELDNLAQLGFIAKSNRGQTDDLKVAVVQGRRDVYSGGEGTQDAPFILATAADLKSFSETPGDWSAGCYVRLDADIDASALSATIGSIDNPYAGVFNGNGHVVKNVNLSNNKIGSATGFFGAISGGTVSDLGVAEGKVTGTTYVGLLAGRLISGTVERCYSTGAVTGSSICVGGLVGENVAGSIINGYSGARVENESDYATGGLVGKNTGTITNTYASGEVTGHDYVGGLAGANYGTVSNSVALNNVITAPHDFVARFGGNNNVRNAGSGNISWIDMEAGRGTWSEHGDHAAGKYSKDLKDQENFENLTGWDFDNVWEWRNDNNKEYPALRNIAYQHTPISDDFYLSITGVKSVTETECLLKVGPNPTDGILYLHASDGLGSYSLFTVNGTQVVAGHAAGATEASIDMSAMSSGLYILRAATADGQESSFKVIRK